MGKAGKSHRRNKDGSRWQRLELFYHKDARLRLTQKGALYTKESPHGKMYYPAVDEDKSRRDETKHFLDRIYNGSVRMLFSNLVKDSKLSDKEAEELMELIDKMED